MTASELSSINRANGAHSTGPKTVEGKQRAAMNALKHGLTGQRLILQPEEQEAYRELTEALHAELLPKTTMELQIVQKIIDCHMRLNRVAVLDNNMLDFGLIENLADPEQPDDTEIAHAQAHSWIAQQMSFEKLGRYEGRLSRQLLAYTKEFQRLQAIRAVEANARERGETNPLRTRPDVLRPIAAAAQSAQTIKGQNVSRHNPSAPQSPWSPASFGSTPSAAPEPAANRTPAPASTPQKEAA